MNFLEGTLLYSASDLVNFLGCPHLTVLDIQQLTNPAPLPEPDEHLLLLQEKGIEHERSYLDSLYGRGLSIVEIDSGGPLIERVELTREAMRRGAQVIYQGALTAMPWHGYADFLLRFDDSQSKLGPYSYEVLDTKLARSPKPKHLIQLCAYSSILANELGISPHRMHLLLGDGSEVALRLSEFLHYFALAQERFEKFATKPDELTSAPCAHCKVCRWAKRCEEAWDIADDLCLVAGISRGQRKHLRGNGIITMTELAGLPEGARIPKIQPETLRRLRSQAGLQSAKRQDGENRYEILPAIPGKGFERLPRPDKGDIFFDMEGDPFYENGLEYLFGFIHEDDRGKPVFTCFWAHNRMQEKKAFEDAVDFMTTRLERFPQAYIYHYASYEDNALKKLAMLHGTRESEIDDLLRGRKLVDLYKVVRESVRVSEPSYSIKNLEAFYSPGRSGTVTSAGDSIVVYERWRKLKDPRLLDDIADYNRDDCLSLLSCRNWLLRLKPGTDINWFTPERKTDPGQEAKAERRREFEGRNAHLRERLMATAGPDDRAWKELLGHLLDFHRREAKPDWWAMFNRQEMTEEDLINDPESLGGLIQDRKRPPFPEKRSIVYSYKFPAQDYKMRVDEQVIEAVSLDKMGSIFEIDENELRVSLKILASNPAPPKRMSIIPDGPVGDNVLRNAITRYAEAVAGKGQLQYPAVTGILSKSPVRLKGRLPGTPIIPDEGELLVGSIDALSLLDESYMLIQGPPGAGKTFTASHAIIELLSQGKRIGVASNSHKAINNLLDAVVRVAEDRRVFFSGVKKSSREEQQFGKSRLIEDVFDNNEVFQGSFDLIAGTAWLFAREELDQTLDYLFIDEAGQVSLANVVAMGLSSKNIVLIGDQMQLSQPTKGTHPGESGMSALEYLLGDCATVPPDRGIFLNVTRRMHPVICRFISEAVYDGRLLPDERNQIQELLLAPGLKGEELVPAGLRFIEVHHEGNSQKSEEEAARLHQTYENLHGQKWKDRNGDILEIGTEDILVVSPYNMQVNHLRGILPHGARVGTVDKFQGQEAPVVLISMATSSAEDLPRNLDFLFSRNRLNVAISRARCLAVIYASSRLFEVKCNSIENMRLINTLCWAFNYSRNTYPQ